MPAGRRDVHSSAVTRVAYFVSAHGFGHAARASAVMAELRRRCPAIHFEIFTEVPKWFFSESLPRCFSYHRIATDVGLVQTSPLTEDLDATVEALDHMWHDNGAVEQLAGRLRELRCSVAVVDISPFGLAAAAAASLPSILIENFTWDWIYAEYHDAPARLRAHGRNLADVFATAGLRIQTDPVCQPVPGAETVPPVARVPKLDRAQVRAKLDLPSDGAMVVVSMGGVPWDYRMFSDGRSSKGPWIVIPGGAERRFERRERLILLPFHAQVYHPDLVAASDIVVGKLGYSTVAETYRAGARLCYVGRLKFPESPVLARWVNRRMVAAEITEDELRNGAWLAAAEGLLKKPRRMPEDPNGAMRAVDAILERFESHLD